MDRAQEGKIPAKRPVRKKPKRSLRTILTVWFLLFSVVPLAFFTFYSVAKFKEAIEKELQLRLNGNVREFSDIVTKYLDDFTVEIENIVRTDEVIRLMRKTEETSFSTQDKDKRNQFIQKQVEQLKRIYLERFESLEGTKLSFLRPDGTFYFSAEKNEIGQTQFGLQLGQSTMRLSQKAIEKFDQGDAAKHIVVYSQGFLNLIVNRRVHFGQETVGYVELAFILSNQLLNQMKSRFGAEVFVLDDQHLVIGSSSEIFFKYPAEYFKRMVESGKSSGIEVDVKEIPYTFILKEVNWGDEVFYVGLGASKETPQKVISNVSIAFFSMSGAILVLLVLTIVLTANSLLRPLYQLVSASIKIQETDEVKKVPVTNDTEIGLLAESFNEMAQKIIQARTGHKEKIRELEKINKELKQTQAQLVQSAKLASLGELVAGVAHELNNPISYIYSNMEHLTSYTDDLQKLIEQAEKDPAQLDKLKKELDYDYIKEDLPKLIASCEEGAKRTRDIVLGLKTFSRIDRGQLTPTRIEEGIEASLNLLNSEIKDRINVKKDFAETPLVHCYPGQLNQVFMNILQNAVQAVSGDGEIFISTKYLEVNDHVAIEIRDTGCGMSEETLRQIFDPFFTTKSIGQGTGLGMSISYGIVESHGGKIFVKSTLGKGSTFRIEIPVKGPTI